MPAEATWFGPPGRPLAGWLHVPASGRARGGVVLCPPLGMEQVNSRRTLRTLAERLAHVGLASLRFDYAGTGDSAGGPDDPARVQDWLTSIRQADAEIRTVVGDAPVAHVGLRMGATLAISLLAAGGLPPVVALVAWDACPSGRRFLRQQAALGRMVGCEPQPDGSIDTPGVRYPADTASDLERIDAAAAGRVAVPAVLVLSRSAGSNDSVLPDQPGAEREVVVGMQELLEAEPVDVVVPVAAVARCVAWLDGVLPHADVAVRVCRQPEATVADGVRERHLLLGPLGLTAVETTSTRHPVSDRPVLMLTTGGDNHAGPVRLWSHLSRLWAAQGVRTIRLDISGLGDSPTRPGCPDDLLYAPHDEQDVLAALAAVEGGARAVLVGLCSGAHLSLRVVRAVPSVSAVAVNIATLRRLAPLPIPRPEFGSSAALPRRVLRAVGLLDVGRRLRRRLASMSRGVPAVVWTLAGPLRITRSPGRGLVQLARADATLICGSEDAYGYQTRGRWDLLRARRAGLDFVVVPGLDHTPMSERQRRAVGDLLTESVLRRVAG